MAIQAAAYTLGKLHSKYLILEIIGFAGDRIFAKTLLSTSSHNLRTLLIKNYQLLLDSVEDQLLFKLTSESQLLNPQLLFSRRLSIGYDSKNDICQGLLHLQAILGKKQQLNLHSLTYLINDEADE